MSRFFEPEAILVMQRAPRSGPKNPGEFCLGGGERAASLWRGSPLRIRALVDQRLASQAQLGDLGRAPAKAKASGKARTAGRETELYAAAA